MAKQDIRIPNAPGTEDNIPIVTIPNNFSKSYGNIFLIVALLIGEAVGAYLIIDNYYPEIYDWVYGHPPDYGGYYDITDIVVNPNNSEGLRFLVISLSLELRSPNDVALVQRNEVLIMDAIITMLSRRTVEELSSVESRGELKDEIGTKINTEILGKSSVREVLFTKYVMQ